MKKWMLSLFVVMSTLVASAQRGDVKTVVVNTPTIVCKTGVQTLVENLMRYDGVQSVKVNLSAKTTTVKYLGDRTNHENIKAAIANAGYKADEIDANPDMFKLLPKCCKKE